MGENGEKMSKSRGNVINPDDIVEEYGADTLRLYEMFIGDFEKSAPWSPSSIKGCKRFLERVEGLMYLAKGTGTTPKLERSFHKTIKKVTEDIDSMKFNTAIAAMMSLVNEINDAGAMTVDELKTLVKLLCPFAPHLAEELWSRLGETELASLAKWPEYDEAKTVDDTVVIALSVQGKPKDTAGDPAGRRRGYGLCRCDEEREIRFFAGGKADRQENLRQKQDPERHCKMKAGQAARQVKISF